MRKRVWKKAQAKPGSKQPELANREYKRQYGVVPVPDSYLGPAFNGRCLLDKYKYPNFVAACGVRPYSTDIQAWLDEQDVIVTPDNWIVIAIQIRDYFTGQRKGQLSLFPDER